MVVRKTGTGDGESKQVQIGNYPLGSDMYRVAKALRNGPAQLNLGDSVQEYFQGMLLLQQAGLLDFEEVAKAQWKQAIVKHIQKHAPKPEPKELPRVEKKVAEKKK